MTTLTNVSRAEFLANGVDPDAMIEILEVNELVTRDASITRITAKIQNDIITVTGTARRSPGDKPNERIGVMLATGRAYAALAKRIERRARGLVEHCADIKEQRPGQRERSDKWRENVLRIASTDGNVQRAALREKREREGSWERREATITPNAQAVAHNGRTDCV